MSYLRVIPRDLFNEASLLKCYGRLYLALEKLGMEHQLVHFGNAFRVDQNEADGSISIANVALAVRGWRVTLFRPLNARAPWPLWARLNDEDCQVFDDAGQLTPEMLEFLLDSS